MKPLVLASGSPRRREYLELLGIPLEVVVSGAEEKNPGNLYAVENAKFLAEKKALDVAQKVGASRHILAADTIVALGSQELGKPLDAEDARRMLSMLSNRSHTVFTGVSLAHLGQTKTLVVSTEVRFRALTKEMVEWYIASGEPFDKAGAYGIQGLAAAFVEAVEGSYSNVVGLPLVETSKLLEDAGYAPWSKTGKER
ncbi:MAG: septum formation inhibitor Maf [Deltaproteobacteria bacterium]|nr:MAG: septum formation inhibitor Maf [Deltaproteobacteria bacterium]